MDTVETVRNVSETPDGKRTPLNGITTGYMIFFEDLIDYAQTLFPRIFLEKDF